jgi:hypothetical protein
VDKEVCSCCFKAERGDNEIKIKRIIEHTATKNSKPIAKNRNTFSLLRKGAKEL